MDRHTTHDRRRVLAAGLGAAASFAARAAFADSSEKTKSGQMSPKAFVYTELQISVPFDQIPWRRINDAIRAQPGFLNKTWFAGVGNHSGGGFYAFDSIENAQRFVTGYFPSEAASFGVAQTTRVFDAEAVREASLDIGSPHFGARPERKPGAFVYTEVQTNLPFSDAPWAERNPVLQRQKGLLAKTWLSGLHTNSIGGVDAFDTVENALSFAIHDFPETAKRMNAAFYTRVFDADAAEEASREMASPYYA